ncbi:hypothetical protein L6452_35838 [Arctium lappa]|uniref:Uncharacterized protein n=1 Tax=Arctium lappa TaxID=4217 RepID=A0ACB8Y7M7_ARCLA|nr:hypothetical protein L6452_35838 [Arctium lappa]
MGSSIMARLSPTGSHGHAIGNRMICFLTGLVQKQQSGMNNLSDLRNDTGFGPCVDPDPHTSKPRTIVTILRSYMYAVSKCIGQVGNNSCNNSSVADRTALVYLE